jgi:hypothetical protein
VGQGGRRARKQSLPPLTDEGRARVRAMLARRESEMKHLALLVDDSAKTFSGLRKRDASFEELPTQLRVQHIEVEMLAALIDWTVLVQRSIVERLYAHEHLMLHLLYDSERPVRGERLKDLQALMGDHGVRLLSIEEEMETVHSRLGAAVNDLANRIALGTTLESGDSSKVTRHR